MLKISDNENFDDFRLGIRNHLEVNAEDIDETATSLHSIAQSYLMEGSLAEAEIYFEKAIALYRLTPDEFGRAFCLSQYSLILKHLAKSDEAEAQLLEVVRLSKNLRLKRKDIRNWFLKSYFHNLLEIFHEPKAAIDLRAKLYQEYDR